MKARMGLKEVGEHLIQMLSPCRPERLSSQLVTVVPTLLPIMMPMA